MQENNSQCTRPLDHSKLLTGPSNKSLKWGNTLTHQHGHTDQVEMRYMLTNDHCQIAPQYDDRVCAPSDASQFSS